MGREFHEQFDHDIVEFESYHPGCMGGIFNILDYHHWYNVKKMFPHRKYNRGRHARCCANPQTLSMVREPGETQGLLLDGEPGHIQVQQQTRKTGSNNKSSGKAYTKGLTGKQKSKEESHKHRILGFSARPQLQQTDSTHHQEPSGFGLGWMNPIVLVRKRTDTSDTSSTSSLPETSRKQVVKSKKSDIHDRVNADSQLKHKEIGKQALRQKKTIINQKPMAKKLNISDTQIEGVDVLEIFKVNKDLFLDILQDPEVGISQHFPGKQASKKVILRKSGSFPVSDPAHSRYLRSSTLEHKQKEVWSFKKGEKSRTGTQLSKPTASSTDDSFRSIITEEASSSSQGSDSQRWNHLVMNRLKDIKQRIKQALRERRKSINETMVDRLTLQVSSRDTLSKNERKMSESLEKTAVEQDASDHDLSNGRLRRIRRTTSINESLDRYSQLFENSVSKEPNLHHSKSLKLSSEDKVPSRPRAPKFFRRISSLSDLESFCSLLHEVSRDAFSSEIPIRTVLNYDDAHKENDGDPKSISLSEDMDKFELVEAVLEADLQESMKEIRDNRCSTGLLVDRNLEKDDKVELAMEKSSHHQEQESVLLEVNPSKELTLRTSASDDIACCRAEHSISEGGLELSQSFTMLKGRCSASHENLESDKEHDPYYNYVRDILELSGFLQDECLQTTWCSPDQPLNPQLLKELETLLHPQLECSIDEVGISCDHQLVFDLVNEALLEISAKSSIYFPKHFSFNSRVKEVWTKVSSNLASQPEPDQSLDDIVARDLAKDAWMNLQAEAEFVALELEDLVFDELLDEILNF